MMLRLIRFVVGACFHLNLPSSVDAIIMSNIEVLIEVIEAGKGAVVPVCTNVHTFLRLQSSFTLCLATKHST